MAISPSFATTATCGPATCARSKTTGTIPATVAEAFVNVPYLWGGKSWAGIDCSGLVQVAFQACGFDCPRDSDMLQAGFGRPLKQDRPCVCSATTWCSGKGTWG
jgi:cell wall-associated NlpC family hydrolase